MKFVIKGEKAEQTVEFWLEERSDGVLLKARLLGGNTWNILKITEEGVYRNLGVSTELKLPLDDGNRVKLNE